MLRTFSPFGQYVGLTYCIGKSCSKMVDVSSILKPLIKSLTQVYFVNKTPSEYDLLVIYNL